MKKGQIILSAAALLVTAGTTLAFKTANKFRTVKVHVITHNSGCALCSDVWTDIVGTTAKGASSCHTSVGSTLTAGRNNKTFWTTSSCSGTTHAVTKVTKVQ
jgi:hypothetical protein